MEKGVAQYATPFLYVVIRYKKEKRKWKPLSLNMIISNNTEKIKL